MEHFKQSLQKSNFIKQNGHNRKENKRNRKLRIIVVSKVCALPYKKTNAINATKASTSVIGYRQTLILRAKMRSQTTL
jgi:hypothetical protein